MTSTMHRSYSHSITFTSKLQQLCQASNWSQLIKYARYSIKYVVPNLPTTAFNTKDTRPNAISTITQVINIEMKRTYQNETDISQWLGPLLGQTPSRLNMCFLITTEQQEICSFHISQPLSRLPQEFIPEICKSSWLTLSHNEANTNCVFRHQLIKKTCNSSWLTSTIEQR